MRRLGDLLLDIKPGFATRDNLEEGVFQFRMHNFTRNSTLDLSNRRRVRPSAKQLETQSVAVGDVLFNATNSPDLVGKSALIGELDEPAVFSNHFMRLRADPELLEHAYLAHFLRFQFTRGVFRAMAKAWVNQATVGRDRLENLQIPLPSLDEQHRIAAILDHADTLRAKRRRVLTYLDSLTQATFNDMFGSETPATTLGEVSIVQGGLQVSRKRAGLPIEVPYLRVANVHRGRLDMSQVKTLQATAPEIGRTSLAEGDLLIVEGHANPMEIGRVAAWAAELATCVHQNHIIRARLDREHMLPEFVVSWLNSQRGAAHFRRAGKTTSGLNTISTSTVKSAPIPRPTISMQSRFADRVEGINARRLAAQGALMAHDELFASLQSRAFRGEL